MRLSLAYDRGQSSIRGDEAAVREFATCILCGRAPTRFAFAVYKVMLTHDPQYVVACLCDECPVQGDDEARDVLHPYRLRAWHPSFEDAVCAATAHFVMSS